MFEGFREETMQFLWGVRLNNQRSWFLEHKAMYETFLYQPLKELGAEVQEELQCPCVSDLSGRPPAPRTGAVQRPPVVHPAPAGRAVGHSGAGVLF